MFSALYIQQAAKEAAEEHVAQLAGRKKTVMQEKRQKKEQKQEAERHTKLVEALVRTHAPLPPNLPLPPREHAQRCFKHAHAHSQANITLIRVL